MAGKNKKLTVKSSPLRERVSSAVDSFSKPNLSFGSSLLKQFLLFSALFLAAALLFWFLSPSFLPKPSWEYSIIQSPLVKNTPLQLHAGDYLVYIASFNGQNQPARLDLSLRSGCRGVFMVDSSAQAQLSALGAGQNVPLSSYSVCLGMDGNERNPAGEIVGNNVSFSNLSWPYFQPWMLALQDNWTWSINTALRIQPYDLSYPQKMSYRVLGRSAVFGREAFVVEISPEGGYGQDGSGLQTNQPATMFVDVQKRVLLRADYSNLSIELTDASFFSNHSIAVN